MNRLTLSHIDGKIHLVLHGDDRGRASYTHLAEIDRDLALEIGRYGIVCWADGPTGRPVRPAVVFSDRGPSQPVLGEIFENLSEDAAPVASFEVSANDALSVVGRDSIYIISWEGGEPSEDALTDELLAA